MNKWRQPSDVDLQNCKWKFGQFIVRVLRHDEMEEAMNLIKELLRIRDDSIFSGLGFDAVSIDSLIKYIEKHNQDITFGCFLKPKKTKGKSATKPNLEQEEGPGTSNMEQEERPAIPEMEEFRIKPKLVAVDALYVRNMHEVIPEAHEDEGKAFKNWLALTKKIEQQMWSMGNGTISNILTSFGVFVSAEFKDKGIPKEMIKNRKKLASTLRIDVTGAAIIGKKEQKAAENNKYKILHVIKKEDSAAHGLVYFSKADLEKVFPIAVMGLKKVYKRKRTVSGAHNDHKRQRTGNN